MLVEDTVHSTLDDAPLINAALGITIRGAGLTRCRGGMWGIWRRFLAHYREMGGEVHLGCPVESVGGALGRFELRTRRGTVSAAQVVSALPAALTACLAPAPIARALQPYLRRDSGAQGGAFVVFLGVPETEVGGQAFTHHQLFQDYARPLGDGNNMFVSVSAPGDAESAPAGYRAVMLSSHCELADWEGLTEAGYAARKAAAGANLIALARRVYPDLGRAALFQDIGTPRTYARFTGRPRGAVGGVRQNLGNANQSAVPYPPGDARFLARRRHHLARIGHRRLRPGQPPRRRRGARRRRQAHQAIHGQSVLGHTAHHGNGGGGMMDLSQKAPYRAGICVRRTRGRRPYSEGIHSVVLGRPPYGGD